MTPQLINTPTLETERLILRGPKGDDWEHWSDLAISDRSSFIGGPYTREFAWRAWGTVIGHWAMRGFGMFVLELKAGGAPIGHVGHWMPEGWPEREIGWTIWDTKSEGTGLAYEAGKAVRDYTFGALGWNTAVSYIDHGNERSIALAKRLGAYEDLNAKQPKPDHQVHIYRHPKPEASA